VSIVCTREYSEHVSAVSTVSTVRTIARLGSSSGSWLWRLGTPVSGSGSSASPLRLSQTPSPRLCPGPGRSQCANLVLVWLPVVPSSLQGAETRSRVGASRLLPLQGVPERCLSLSASLIGLDGALPVPKSRKELVDVS
jgi:hypothetical protein